MPPLSLTSDLVVTVNGKTFDMAIPGDKDSIVNDNLVYWIDHLRESIRQLGPTALVTTSFFVPQTPIETRVGDSRFILTEAVIAQSQADFIDLHPYPGWGLSLSQYASNFGITGSTQKPILMGEFGASTSIYVFVASKARTLQNWQIE
jgi:endo-1,4-beta-mannosidase